METEAIGTEKNKKAAEPEGSVGHLNEDDDNEEGEDDEMRLVKVNLRIIF